MNADEQSTTPRTDPAFLAVVRAPGGNRVVPCDTCNRWHRPGSRAYAFHLLGRDLSDIGPPVRPAYRWNADANGAARRARRR